MFGPNALDTRYAVPGPMPAVPDGSGGRGFGRRVALLVILVAAVVGLTQVQVPTARADSVSGTGSGGNCVTALTAYSTNVTGWVFLSARFRLVMTDQTVVQFGWSINNGSVNHASFVVGPGTFFVGPSSNEWTRATDVGFQPGSTGTAKFYIQKASPIGSCFKVSDVVIVRTPYQQGAPQVTPPPNGGGFATPTPLATGTPTPTPVRSAPVPTSSACALVNGNVPETCDPPPGYCWAYGPTTTPGSWPVVPCLSSPSPSPTATPSNDYDDTCTFVNAGQYSQDGCNGTNSAEFYGGDVWDYTISLTSSGGSNTAYREGSAWFCPLTGAVGNTNTYGTCFHPEGALNSSVYEPIAGTAQGWTWGTGGSFSFTGTRTIGSGWTAGPYAWSFHATSGCGGGCGHSGTVTIAMNLVTPGGGRPSPSPTPTPGASATPTGTPTLPPGWNPPDLQSPGNDPGDEGEGPVNICPPGTAIAACRTPIPNGSGDIGIGYQADPSGLISLLSEKAPFGYVVQIGEAIGDGLASPGSATPDLCETFTLGPLGEFEFCIPTEPFDFLEEWRWFAVLLVWLAGSIALYRIASAGVGNVE